SGQRGCHREADGTTRPGISCGHRDARGHAVIAEDVRIEAAALARLQDTSGARQWDVSADALGAALRVSVAHRFAAPPGQQDLETYLASIHLGDLAVAAVWTAR